MELALQSPPRLSLRSLASMSLYTLGVNFVWIAYGSIVLPLQVETVVPPESKGLVLGLIAGLSTACGVTANLLSGIVSDHSTSRWGRRRPHMLAGALLTLPCMAAAALLPLSLPLVFLGYLGAQVFTNVSAGAYQPVLADFVPEDQRGLAAGLQGFFTLTGAALGFGLIAALVEDGRFSAALIAMAGAFLATTALGSRAIRPHDRPLPDAQGIGFHRAFGEMFRLQARVGGFFWLVLGSFLIFMGLASFQFFGLYYFQTVLRHPSPVRALQVTGLVNLAVSMVAAVAAGFASDRVGRRDMIVAAAVLSGVICLLMPFPGSFVVFLLLAAAYAVGSGVVYSVTMALASSMVPPAEAGKYMAYANLATGLAGAAAPPVFGALLNAGGAPTVGSFVAFFAVAATFYFAGGAVILLRVPRR